MGSQIPKSSSPTTKGNPVSSSTCFVYAPGPLVAKALETKCSIRNNPTGIIPLSECSRRSKNEWPLPARKGATPRVVRMEGGLAADATKLLVRLEVGQEPFIMLLREK